MKIRMRRLHLFILLFVTCSLLFHAPLPEASAAVGDITPIRIKNHAAFESASDNFEHDPDGANYNSFIQVDSDTYALAYASAAVGTNNHGFIATFTISSDGETITEVASLRHDTSAGVHNSLVQVDSDTYLLAYLGQNQ